MEFVCKVCQKTFSHKQSLSKHTANICNPSRSCEICGIVFSQRSSYLRHKRRFHPNDFEGSEEIQKEGQIISQTGSLFQEIPSCKKNYL